MLLTEVSRPFEAFMIGHSLLLTTILINGWVVVLAVRFPLKTNRRDGAMLGVTLAPPRASSLAWARHPEVFTTVGVLEVAKRRLCRVRYLVEFRVMPRTPTSCSC